MKESVKKIVLGVLVVVVVIVAAGSLFNGGEHIEDTNGAEDHSLTTITDADIVEGTMYALGLEEKTGVFSDNVTYYSKKYTGVSEIGNIGYSTAGTLVTVNHAQVTEGNFCIAVVVDGEIVHKFALNELTQSYTVDRAGSIQLMIAGESAAFELDYSMG